VYSTHFGNRKYIHLNKAPNNGVCSAALALLCGYRRRKIKRIKHIPTKAIKHSIITFSRGRDSSVGMARGYGLNGRSLILGRGKKFFFTQWGPDRLRFPSSLPFKWHRRLLRRRQSGWGVKLTTHLHIVLTSRMCGVKAPLCYTSSWPGAEKILLFKITIINWHARDISVSKLMITMLYLRFSQRWRWRFGLAVSCSVTPCRQCTCLAGSLLGLLFQSEDVGRMFICNTGEILPDYSATHHSWWLRVGWMY
jgi:hypothetical protein